MAPQLGYVTRPGTQNVRNVWLICSKVEPERDGTLGMRPGVTLKTVQWVRRSPHTTR